MIRFTLPIDAKTVPPGYYWFIGEGRFHTYDLVIIQITGQEGMTNRVVNFFNTSTNEWLDKVDGTVIGPIEQPEED